MFLVLADGRRLTADDDAWAGRDRTEMAVAGPAVAVVAVLPRTGCGDQGNEMRAGEELSALRHSTELLAAVEVAFLNVR